jgi:hypothetical protein
MRFWPLLRSVVGALAYMLPLAALKGPDTADTVNQYVGWKT